MSKSCVSGMGSKTRDKSIREIRLSSNLRSFDRLKWRKLVLNLELLKIKVKPMKIWKKLTESNSFLTIILLTILTFLVRFPYFFEATIDADENTFILLGQSVLDGYLPYTEILDIKSILLWYSFALFIAVFGKTIVSIRLAGTLCIIAAGFLTYLIGQKLRNSSVGFIASILFVLFASLLPSGQAVMSEHVALIPLMGALALLSIRKNTPPTLFTVGIMMALANLVRLNLAYVSVVLGIVIFVCLVFNSSQSSLKRNVWIGTLAYVMGFMLTVFLFFLPYFLLGKVQVLWTAFISAALKYSAQSNSFLVALSQLEFLFFRGGLSSVLYGILIIVVIVWIGKLLRTSSVPLLWASLDRVQQKIVAILLVTGIAIELSILRGGVFYGHYLIQFSGIFSVLFAFLIFQLLNNNARRIKYLLTIVLTLVVVKVFPQYISLGYQIAYGLPVFNGCGYAAADFLKLENTDKDSVLILNDGCHIAYWLTETKPLTPAVTHPSNINNEVLLKAWFGNQASTLTELDKIIYLKPKFIISSDNFFPDTTAQSRFNEFISKFYIFVQEIEGGLVLFRKG